jgi:hypothetical protein
MINTDENPSVKAQSNSMSKLVLADDPWLNIGERSEEARGTAKFDTGNA